MRRAAALVMFVAVTLGAAACGGGADNTMTRAAHDELAPLVSQVRARAEAFDPYGAALALGDVRHAVRDLRARGAIGDARADAILSSVDEVGRKLPEVPTTTTTTTTTTTAPPAPAVPVGGGGENDHGKGKGEDKGGGKGKH